MMRVRALKSDADAGAASGKHERSNITAAAYANFAPYVRGRLAALGVRDADLPDLCHEVFLVVHDKVDLVPGVERVDLWLRAICRRVAAGYRRRFAHKLEILRGDPEAALPADDPMLAIGAGGADNVEGPGAGSERREQLALVRRALNRLDEESRDLLALHDVGQMPLTDLALLVDHDRKTVRKRLVTARRRVSRLVSQEGQLDGPPSRLTPPRSTAMQVQAAKGRVHGCRNDELEVVQVSEHRKVGYIGNVALATWGGQLTGELLDQVLHIAPHSVERCGGEIVYLALVEPTFRPPSLAARQKLVDALDIIGPYISAFAVALLGGTSSISEPIVSGMMLLAGPRFPMRAFAGIEPAAAWLCETYAHGAHGPLSARTLAAAGERLRALRPETFPTRAS